MKTSFRILGVCAAVVIGAAAEAQDTGAQNNGNWNNPALWTAGTIPGPSNSVFIGSTYPTGAAPTATVALTQAQSAANVYLGFDDTGGTGTLNLGSFPLTIGGDLSLGRGGGTGHLVEGAGGSFTAQNAYVYSGNALTFGGSDAVTFLHVQDSSTATTAATGNLTYGLELFSGSTLNLGAGMSLTGNFDVRDANSIVNLNGHPLTVATQLLLGWYDGQPVTLNRGGAGGTLTAISLYVGNNSFNLLASDMVTNYYLRDATSTLNRTVAFLHAEGSSNATTTAGGSATGGVEVFTGSTLNLGASMSVTGNFDVRDANSIVNLNNHPLTVGSQLLLGWYNGQPVTLNRGGAGGTLAATSLYVGNSAFNLLAADIVTNYYLANGTSTLNSTVAFLHAQDSSNATTNAGGSATGGVEVFTGSTLNLGASMSVTGNFDVRDSNTIVNLNSHPLTVGSQLLLGWYDSQPVTLNRGGAGGTLTATSLYVGNNSFNLPATDIVTNYYLGNATSTLNSTVAFLHAQDSSDATTTAGGSATVGVEVFTGSTLNLGASMSVSGNFDVRDSNTIVNLNGHPLTVGSQLLLGWYDSQPVTLNRGGSGGTLTATSLYVGNNTFSLLATDTVTNYSLANATSTLNSTVSLLHAQDSSSATTTTGGSATGGVEVFTGSTLKLGADLSLTGNLDLRDHSTLDAQHHGITANQLLVGYYDTSPAQLGNNANVHAAELYTGNGSTPTLHGGDVVDQLISLNGGSVLQVQQTGGTGLTLNGTPANSLTIAGSTLHLTFAPGAGGLNWVFRWQDPAPGIDHITALKALISAGQITVSAPSGVSYAVFDLTGYTYIAKACRGDTNCDGRIDFEDINPFVAALGGGVPCNFANVDINGDDVIDFADINPFVSILGAGGGPCP